MAPCYLTEASRRVQAPRYGDQLGGHALRVLRGERTEDRLHDGKVRPPPYGPKAGATAPGSHASRGAACGRYPETKQGMQSAIMPILWIVQQQLDKAHHITPTTVVKGAVAFPAQGSGGWVRPTLPWTLTLAVILTLAVPLTLILTPTLTLTLTTQAPSSAPTLILTLTPPKP